MRQLFDHEEIAEWIASGKPCEDSDNIECNSCQWRYETRTETNEDIDRARQWIINNVKEK